MSGMTEGEERSARHFDGQQIGVGGGGLERDPWKHRSAGMRCRTCVFYVPKAPDGLISTVEAKIGRCRRNAPTMKGFPAVFPQDWCGDHRIDENRL